jgi:hypothetical protein
MIFTNSKKPAAPLIRFVTWSQFSHVAVMIDDDTIVHADFKGVRVEPIKDLQDRSDNWMIVEYECENPQDVISACLTQVGKPYDFTGLVGIIIRDIDIQDDSKWWCSELPMYGSAAAKWPTFNLEFIHRLTPQHWLMLPHKIIKTSGDVQ